MEQEKVDLLLLANIEDGYTIEDMYRRFKHEDNGETNKIWKSI